MSRLFAMYKTPWRIVQDESVDPDRFIGGYVVYDANGHVIVNGGTYSGDGDAENNLNRLQWAELVEIVNASDNSKG